MIFRRALLREMASNALLVFSVLLMITLTTMLIRYLGQAAGGAVANEAVAAFLGFSIVNYLPVLLSLTVFIAVLMTLTRCYRDSEMVVWFTAGLSVAAWVRPVIAFAAPAVFAIAFLSLVVSPWALRKSDEFRQQLDSRDDVYSVAPGVFKESKFAERVYFVESFAGEKNTVSNIFMRSVQHQKLGILVAQHGYQTVSENGDRFLVLLNGRRYEGVGGTPDYKVMAFERYSIRMHAFEASLTLPTQKSLSTLMLLSDRSAANMGELLWRLGLPLSAFILALLAIPLSFVNPRAGRSLNLILALLLYMIYSNFLSITQAWVAQGKLSPYIGLWLVHGVMLLVLLLLFYRRLVLAPFWMTWLKRLIHRLSGEGK
ncbi:LPS export ABC transporter permease LptF [Sulfuricella sp.]|uniref:LPS export ABC transporter permease LptF n=1 Tax=Sulfuricella sp. TaxID=2099377 RepID=UPI002C0E7DC9|nr:LPS export ABC transporter permease LptF [Sulfuricella sp.]HUX64612.1 LPS export ABC transporter permease LptF [Sulfuricella sp.]